MKCLIIGDIHGCWKEFMTLVDRAGLCSEDRIVALGDIMDRGPDSEKVLNFFIENQQASCIKGNHEHKHILIYDGIIKSSLSQKITIQQFSRTAYKSFITFIRQFPEYLDIKDALLVHGSFEPSIPITEQKQPVLLGTRNGEMYLKKRYKKPWYKLYNEDKPIIAGHRDYSKKGEVKVINNKIFLLDTGCCYGKKLSGLLLPDYKIFQVKSSKNYWGIIKQQRIS
jgi:serine/threonine protein phosphatase 1